MKKIIFTLLLMNGLFHFAQAQAEAVEKVLDAYGKAAQNKDLPGMMQHLTDDALLLGSAPDEFWTKQAFEQMLTYAFKPENPSPAYQLDKRVVRMGEDGNSAVVIEQGIFMPISTVVPTRTIYYLVKTGNNWKINLWSIGMIPKNPDLAVINKAVETKK